MTIYDIIIYTTILFFGIALWQHLNISQQAKSLAEKHTDKYGVTLLDQSVTLKALRLRRSHRSLWTIERRYNFEFSTHGDTRYQGVILFRGKYFQHIELQPFK